LCIFYYLNDVVLTACLKKIWEI